MTLKIRFPKNMIIDMLLEKRKNAMHLPGLK